MWQQFIDLFSGYGLIAMMVMLFGLLLCMIEIIVPGFGVFGVLGAIFTIGGVVARAIMGTTVIQFLSLVILIVAVVVITALLIVILAKIGLLGRVSIIQEKTAVPTDYEKATKEQRKLIGKVGFAETAFKTSGKFVLDGNVYDAISEGEYIEKGSKVKVVAIKNNDIIVKKV